MAGLGGPKASIRKNHRALNMLSALLIFVGLVAIFFHIVTLHERVLRARSVHWWLALLVVTGIVAQIASGVVKYAAKQRQTTVSALLLGQQDTGKKFTWHGRVGWAVYMGMLFTVNSGVLESALFDRFTAVHMGLQVSLLVIGVGAAHALGKLPALVFELENPVVMLMREYLEVLPEAVSLCLTSPRMCKRLRRNRQQHPGTMQDGEGDGARRA